MTFSCGSGIDADAGGAAAAAAAVASVFTGEDALVGAVAGPAGGVAVAAGSSTVDAAVVPGGVAPPQARRSEARQTAGIQEERIPPLYAPRNKPLPLREQWA